MTREECLDLAKSYVMKDRNLDYDSPERNFEDIAKLWEVFTGYEFTPAQVGIMCGLIKVARMKTSPGKADHYTDLCGYSACAAECATGCATE
jgi:hypothetical protein